MLRALRFVIGAAIAFAIWWYATPAYDGVLCDVLRQFGVHAVPAGRAVRAARMGSPDAQVPADQLTYNFVLFIGLAAAVPTRKVWRLIVALFVVLAIHPIALAVTIERTFDQKSPVWMSLDFLYRIGGMFAIAFACWYAATYGAREPQPETSKKSAKARRASRRDRGSRR